MDDARVVDDIYRDGNRDSGRGGILVFPLFSLLFKFYSSRPVKTRDSEKSSALSAFRLSRSARSIIEIDHAEGRVGPVERFAR